MCQSPRPPLTDSPWFWVMVFSLMALGALAAIGGKYGRRQAAIERQYQARTRIAEQQVAENNSAADSRTNGSRNSPSPSRGRAGEGPPAARRDFATPGETLIPLWPLAALLSLVALVAGTMLVYGRAGASPPPATGGHRILPMTYLAENSLPIWMAAAIALTMALVAWLQTRSNGALGAMLAIVVIAAVLLAVERMIETPREAVERTLYELAEAVEANDLPRTVSYIVPNAPARKEAEELMPLVNIERARVLGTPKIDLVSGGADVKCRGLIVATNKQSGMKGGASDNELTLTFVERDGRWLLQDYSSKHDWHKAIGR